MGALFNSQATRLARSGDIPVWDAKLGQWIPQGKATYYNANGVLDPANLKILALSVALSGNGSPTTSYLVTFPSAFTTTPVVVISVNLPGGATMPTNITNISTVSFQFDVNTVTAATPFNCQYIAIGK